MVLRFQLDATFTFSKEIAKIQKEVQAIFDTTLSSIKAKQGPDTIQLQNLKATKNQFSFSIISEGSFRPHTALLQMKNTIGKELGKTHHIGVREITINQYRIEFDVLKNHPYKKSRFPLPRSSVKILM